MNEATQVHSDAYLDLVESRASRKTPMLLAFFLIICQPVQI